MIERTCKIQNRTHGPYQNVTWCEAAKRAVEEYMVNWDYEVDDLPTAFDVEVTDTESGISRTFCIEASLRLEWVNPREVSGD
jgi:GH25 family lysozyme M1 (1,4-beta-N-acetylmuramidase)